jgi:hypothetical protein
LRPSGPQDRIDLGDPLERFAQRCPGLLQPTNPDLKRVEVNLQL